MYLPRQFWRMYSMLAAFINPQSTTRNPSFVVAFPASSLQRSKRVGQSCTFRGNELRSEGRLKEDSNKYLLLSPVLNSISVFKNKVQIVFVVALLYTSICSRVFSSRPLKLVHVSTQQFMSITHLCIFSFFTFLSLWLTFVAVV
ncbi:hypothetical protein HS088_TW12G00002 [Tripterygium wilfordii]|uniref:Uncharacterized protein n=1 Tax=Tripterygium wilfordii TaxID=458696 RepID=A0A7J7CXY5_TRIWF|nr:uncharacterized protein LOC120010603 [Tripterygium wilfordii]KAF5738809.1 hypothetical protein HS088_TW12G00002 [Tripterygium wilfordii]